MTHWVTITIPKAAAGRDPLKSITRLLESRLVYVTDGTMRGEATAVLNVQLQFDALDDAQAEQAVAALLEIPGVQLARSWRSDVTAP